MDESKALLNANKSDQSADDASPVQSMRDSRRVKQRQQNPLRAQKMHQLRLASEEESTQLAPSKTATIATRTSSKFAEARAVHVGCSGWFYWHWKNLFYPEALPMKDWFLYYRNHFKTVELNAPFYSWPTKSTVLSWLRPLGRSEFVYTVKVCELITHVKQFTGTHTFVRDFGFIADMLGDHMGCLLFQLPPSVHYSRAMLENIIEQLEPQRRNVVEFRHPSWWNPVVYDAFDQAGIIFCSCSGPKLPDELIVTANEAYIRFHGTERWYFHDYQRSELQAWVDRLHDSGAAKVWAYFNNDRDGSATKNARSFERMLKKEFASRPSKPR